MGIDKENYLSTKDMHNLIISWKNTPNKHLLEKILYNFEAYIEKYARMLKLNGYTDKELTSFLYLFGKDIYNTKLLLKQILFSYSYSSIKTELTLIFIDVVKHYKYIQNGPMFPGYLRNYYKFKVKNWIDKISKNPLNKLQKYSFSEERGKENYKKETDNPDYTLIKNENKSEMLDILYQEEFKSIRNILTHQELVITQYYYIEKIPSIKLLHLYSLTRKELNSIIKSIKIKLKDYYNIKES